jgi:AraC-like DNA-binding protein/quercetin dioxygenase-like cupin family protein
MKPVADETADASPAHPSGDTRPPTRARMVEHTAFGAPLRLLTGRYAEHRYHPHVHPEYTLSVIEYGDLRFDAAGRGLRARQGDVVVIEPMAVHDGRNGGPEGFAYRVLYVHPDSLRNALGRDALTLRGGVLEDARCAQALLRGHHALLAWSGTRLGVEVALMAMLEDLDPGLQRPAGCATGTATAQAHALAGRLDRHCAVRCVAQRLDDCPHDNPGLDDLAGEAGLSRRHLTRLFRAELGLSVHQYQVQAKVRAAYGLMRGGLTTAAAAVAVGFADQAHLTRWFWKIYGVSPGAITCR